MRILRVVPTSFLLCCLWFALSAGWPSAAKAPAKPIPPKDMRKLIQSVDAKNNAVVIQYMFDKTTHTYRVDDMTALKVNGVPGKLADIKKGMEVKDYMERDNDDLDSLTLTGYGEEPAAAKPAAKPKPKPKPAATSSPNSQ